MGFSMNRLAASSGWSALCVWLLALAGLGIASVCLVSLTWDGGYYVYCTLQTGSAMIPHNRWINHALLWPVEALAHLETARPAIMVHGLFCYAPVLLALGYGLITLRGRLEPLRLPFCAAVLMGLLPMLMCPTSEVTAAYAGFCLLLAGVWSGCRAVHWPLLAAAVLWMWGSHPVSAPLFGMLGLGAAFPAWKGKEKLRPIITGAIFLLLAAGKMADTMVHASDYEKEQFDLMQWLLPIAHVIACSPWWVIPLSWLWIRFTGRNDTKHRRKAAVVLVLLFVVGIVWHSVPILWGGVINYRKFAMFTGAFFTAWGTWEAARLAREPAAMTVPQRRVLMGLAMVFAVSMLAGSLCWTRMLGSVTSWLEADGRPLQKTGDFPNLKWGALDHWSATPTFLVLEGREPRHVFIGQGTRWTGNAVEIFPGEPLPLEDDWFQFGKLREALMARGEYTPLPTPPAPGETR